MKNKILTTVFVTIFLMGTAMAWEEGQTFSQAQIDGVDVDALTWQDLSCRIDGSHRGDKTFFVDYSCLMLKKTDDSYLVIRKGTSFGTYIPYVRDCVKEYGLSACLTNWIARVRHDVGQSVQRIRDHIKGFQSTDEIDWDDWLGDVTLGD